MTGFINLLFESPLLLFLIIAAIFSFIRSRSSQGEEQQERPGRPQQAGEGQQEASSQRGKKELDWKDILFEGEEKKSDPQMPERSDSQTEMQKHYEEVRRRQRQAEKSTAKVKESPIVKGDITNPDNEGISLDFKNMNKQDVVKGIVWSEVLGKPKSKKHSR
ncbi:hypothetical protein [Alkalicoccus halolimnae]|uniref:Uncharacterized protein n=1 Tax=Alkalicoccus halolimnae TaxID=1667239 RepID=A0A5C7F8T7_9BACI|nr:hypothetical protein [Alkalicoccus halolimnae]TXF86443.1 hypothetical protein FTX54_04230 [Alkalicoccus halolimnae]